MRATARAWRELDLAALTGNLRAVEARLPPGCRVMAVVKADAYGHGAKTVARTLQRAGVRAFAAACLDEASALRRAGVGGEILVLGYTPPELAGVLARWRIAQTVLDEDYACRLSAQGVPLRVHLALDTGMHRFGLPAGDLAAARRVLALPHLHVVGTMSHLCAAGSDPAETEAQAARFFAAVRALEASGLDPGRLHFQASYGVWNLPPQPCGYVRAGLALYGVPSDSRPLLYPMALRPVLSLRARVASVRDLAAGEGAGYDLAFRAERPTRLAVVAMGYADGLPRDLGRRGGEVLLRGRRCPVVGLVCMDQLLADVTGAGPVRSGDIATVIGRDGPEEITAVELAARCGAITNELLSRLSRRLGLVTRRQKS